MTTILFTTPFTHWVFKWHNLLLRVHCPCGKSVTFLIYLHKNFKIENDLCYGKLCPLPHVAEVTTVPTKTSQTKDLECKLLPKSLGGYV